MQLSALDLATRKFWRALGRPIDLEGPQQWLRAPVSDGPVVSDGCLRSKRHYRLERD